MESESSGNILDEDDIKPDVESIKIEVEAEAVVAQHEATKGNNLFHIDRTLIQEVGIEEQDQELRSLGLSVYHQDELEQGILQQVDQALEMQEREDEKRRLEKQIKDVTEDIRCEEQQLSKDETLLRVMKGGSVSVTHAFKVRKDQEMCLNRLTALKAKEKILLSKKAALETGSQDTNEESNENDGILNKKSSGESEHERMIRLGEMTPFGTILANRLMSGPSGSKSSAPKKLTDFQRYLNSQAALEKSHVKPSTSSNTASPSEASCSKDLTSRHKSPLKPSVLNPHKRKIKEKLGCKIGRGSRARAEKPAAQMSETQTIWLDDSDPDFLPDENGDIDDISPPAKKKKAPVRKAKKQRPLREPGSGSEWGSDDDDWESSGDEEKVAKKRKKGKEMDDGNLADYNARIKLWEKERGDEDVTSSHHLCGGLEVPSVIWNKLYKYQQVGVQWMWELFQNGTGGILGDEMGLGKTIQIIAFLAALKHSQMKDTHTGFRGLGASIVVCPTTVMHQWVKEFHVWYPPIRVAVLHDSGNFDGTRNSLIREMSQCKGILITSYQGLVKHQEALLSRSWHLIILDEGHKIRNPDAQATLAAKRVPTPHRLALTGSPMQNNLKELWSLFDFVYPSKLGTLPDFLANFAVPITQGGYANASEVQVATAYHCALSLKETIKPYLLRRMKHDVKNHIQLPSKNEQVLFCKLTEEQRSLYRQYVDSRLVSNILEGRTKIFVGLINLRKICNHPDLFSGKNKLAQDDESIPEDEHYGYWERSGKMAVVQSLLKIWHKQGHRVLLFTQGRQMICILENFVQKEGYSYLKLDGATSIGSRQPLIAEFNNNPSHFVFLLTTRVGGLGVNLTGADRVVIFDPDWNPATDTQARERAWRIGQKKQVTIYRLVTAGTIEEKIYHRQIFKQFLSNKVLNDPKQRRFFKTNDLYELFTLKEANNNSTETSAIFAGTGSEVRVDTSKRKYKHTSKPIDIEPQPVTKPNKIEFSQDKINHMKQLAQKLSQQFASKLANKTETSERDKKNVNVETCERSKEDRTVQRDNEKTKDKTSSSEQVDTTSIVKKIENGFDIKTEAHSSKKTDKNSQPGSSRDTSSRERSYESSSRDKSYERSSNKKHKKHKKHDRKEGHRHRKKGAKFEGERIKHLVNQGDYADLVGKNEEEEESKDENQDDYVLRKLFKKSGLQTALKHDTIMQGGGSDYALVEREARHVAQEAMTRLKESQRQCFRADAGVPTWTGLNGLIKAPPRDKNKAAKKAKPSAALGKAPDPEPEAKKEEQKEEVEEEKEEEKKKDLISGDDLLSMWQKRNRLLRAPSPDRAPTPEHVSGPEFTDEEGPVPGEEELDMLADLPDVEEEEEEEQEEASLFDLEPPEQRPRAAAAVRRSHPQMEAPSTRNTYVTEEETDLLDELRSYLAFGGSISGQASTEELLARFPNSALPTGMAPLFKCLLQSLADFHRNTSAVGIWRLKPEFH